ncbi:hypothetical protein Tco_0914153 [Tanacetum coccineum]
MESIRSRFFNGIDVNEKKRPVSSWTIRCLLKSKQVGLGVSSFYAMNRALMFKWVWRFRTDNSFILLLGTRFLKAMHGEDLPNMKDRWFWSLSGTGEFTAASARQFIDDHLLLEGYGGVGIDDAMVSSCTPQPWSPATIKRISAYVVPTSPVLVDADDGSKKDER